MSSTIRVSLPIRVSLTVRMCLTIGVSLAIRAPILEYTLNSYVDNGTHETIIVNGVLWSVGDFYIPFHDQDTKCFVIY